MRRRGARHARCVLGSQWRAATASHQWTLISIARAVDAVGLEAVAMGGFATTEFSFARGCDQRSAREIKVAIVSIVFRCPFP